MGERKVLNKYYPPDFDPAKIPRRRQPKNQQVTVRTMLPMNIRCNTCGSYIYRFTKFNSRMENVTGETYLGIHIRRFYFKCTNCSAEMTYLTDPRNSDYVVECGATRNFEPWHAVDEEIDNEKWKRDAEEMGDAMKSLENRMLDSKREMDNLAALDELKSMKSTQTTVSGDAMLEVLQRANEEKERKMIEEDEALTRSVFMGSSERYVRRIDDEDIDDDEDLAFTNPAREETSNSVSKRRKLDAGQPVNPIDTLTKSSALGKDQADVFGSSNDGKFIFRSQLVRVSIQKKPLPDSNGNKPREKPNQEGEHNETCRSYDLQSLCQYGSDEDDEL
ncbi:hypothetical protein ACH5RR_037471 [Cinchona calisaya]|uniref:Splicing factor YJU2 n=1 Tax=Cinchona calisaya TaxID=153742 RepID=A0ABD2Y6A3_9GENT